MFLDPYKTCRTKAKAFGVRKSNQEQDRINKIDQLHETPIAKSFSRQVLLPIRSHQPVNHQLFHVFVLNPPEISHRITGLLINHRSPPNAHDFKTAERFLSETERETDGIRPRGEDLRVCCCCCLIGGETAGICTQLGRDWGELDKGPKTRCH